jgi:hypothetical protein
VAPRGMVNDPTIPPEQFIQVPELHRRHSAILPDTESFEGSSPYLPTTSTLPKPYSLP